MTIHDLSGTFGYRCVQERGRDEPLTSAYTSDLLSDVLANGTGKSALVTIQAHKNAVAVCSMTDINVMIICNDRPMPSDMLKAAEEQEIAVFVTPKDQFTVSGELYTALGIPTDKTAADRSGSES